MGGGILSDAFCQLHPHKSLAKKYVFRILVVVFYNSQNAASVDRTQCLQMDEPKLTSVWRSPK
ncbi:hypothetical protein B0J14DRAFT_604510 [Halenospora varia]|nr:hypothetical protein B0J14DRAFT_604510 [Halenospora varia]